MRTTIKYNAILLLWVLALSLTCTQSKAQNYLRVDFKNSNRKSIALHQDSIARIEFEYKNSIKETYNGENTIYICASSGHSAITGIVESDSEITVENSNSWFNVELTRSEQSYYGQEYSYTYNIVAEGNPTDAERNGEFRFKADGAEDVVKNVLQRGYTLSFETSDFINNYKWDGTPSKQENVNVQWNDTLSYCYVIPNYGIKLLSKPSWIEECNIYDESTGRTSYTTVVQIRYKQNVASTQRSGNIILADKYGDNLVITISQAKFDYSSVLEQMNRPMTLAGNHNEFGYSALMHIRDVMTGDMTVVATGYDWFSSWASNRYMGESKIYSQYIWNFYRDLLYKVNEVIAKAEESESNDGVKGVAHAFRAMLYLDAARMYEFLPNDRTSNINEAGNNVENLTLPIVKDAILPRNPVIDIPRATRTEMFDFILSELDKAQELIPLVKDASKEIPHLDAVYGLKARLYMWVGDYNNARKYARLAIENSNALVMTERDCLDTSDGFNTMDKWMWGSQFTEESRAVSSGIVNWTSWMSPEAQFGYNCAGATAMIDAAMYERISNNDFRKLMFKAPAGHTLENRVEYIDSYAAGAFPVYTAIKFRPNDGNAEDYKVGAASAYPLMRLEEMYFIEAEAAEHLNAGEGIALLKEFMTKHRDSSYTFNANADAIEEIVFQKRVELWGEGQTFFDIKRLNMSVTRGYEGSNVDPSRRFNTNGRPAWMNTCIVTTAKQENTAIEGYENPDPSDLYDPVQ